MTKIKKENRQVSKNICFMAIFAALVCVATFISIPLPIGYFNLGDVFVLLSAWCLGPIFGPVAAGVGAALADILMGYAVYAPATFIIKAAVAVAACFLYKLFKRMIKKEKLDFVPRAISAIIAESIMVMGYFLFEALVMSYGMGASVSIVGNCIQAIAGTVGAVALISSRILKKMIS